METLSLMNLINRLDTIRVKAQESSKRIAARFQNSETVPKWAEHKCKDCGLHGPSMFLVQDAVWAEAGYGDKETACFPCFQSKMPRRLTVVDFKVVPMNEMFLFGFTMGYMAEIK